MTVVEEANNKKSVLVVDDNPENIHVLNDILSSYYKVKAAINGKVAIKIVSEQEKPDIILLDIMMADLDGFTVCEYLKKLPDTAEIPIIFVSAKREVADEARGFDLGAVDYITKPISPLLC